MLDISEEKARTINGLDQVTVDEVSFNEHYSYLLHTKSLTNVEIITNPRCESKLPPNSLRYGGHLNIFRDGIYLKEVKSQFKQHMLSAPRD